MDKPQDIARKVEDIAGRLSITVSGDIRPTYLHWSDVQMLLSVAEFIRTQEKTILTLSGSILGHR